MVRNVLTVAFYDPLQPIFDFAESAHAAKYARRIGHFPAGNAALFKLTPLPKGGSGVSLKNYPEIRDSPLRDMTPAHSPKGMGVACLSTASHSGAHLAPEATLRYRSPARMKLVPEHQKNCSR
jgi:hypothetical protein